MTCSIPKPHLQSRTWCDRNWREARSKRSMTSNSLCSLPALPPTTYHHRYLRYGAMPREFTQRHVRPRMIPNRESGTEYLHLQVPTLPGAYLILRHPDTQVINQWKHYKSNITWRTKRTLDANQTCTCPFIALCACASYYQQRLSHTLAPHPLLFRHPNFASPSTRM